MSLRETITATGLPSLKVPAEDIPGWDFDVWVRALTGAERADTLGVFQGPREKDENYLLAWFVAYTVTDEGGARQFDENNEDDIAALERLAGGALNAIAQAGLEYNGLKAESARETAKN